MWKNFCHLSGLEPGTYWFEDNDSRCHATALSFFLIYAKLASRVCATATWNLNLKYNSGFERERGLFGLRFPCVGSFFNQVHVIEMILFGVGLRSKNLNLESESIYLNLFIFFAIKYPHLKNNIIKLVEKTLNIDKDRILEYIMKKKNIKKYCCLYKTIIWI